MRPDDVADAPLDDLLAAAAAIRDTTTGRRITYSPKVFIPLTMLCRDRCGYCTFAQPPARLDAPYLTPEQVLRIAADGAAAGCHEALFTLGERPEDRYPVAGDWLAAHGHTSTVDYLVAMCDLVLTETGLLPHANAGALLPDELRRLQRGEAPLGRLVRRAAVAGEGGVERLEHHPLRGRHLPEPVQLVGKQGTGVGMGEEP
ncbi:MAG TPA: 7,8-didemethyl-8-hydroxy-5-deazariboflavin synthase, partial [Acidimicrobiales bacterium]|nr:7,8-didemethyl-8-hydroxy-5-deazariboflavin synthase [Acidimicrobiales bacterium]